MEKLCDDNDIRVVTSYLGSIACRAHKKFIKNLLRRYFLDISQTESRQMDASRLLTKNTLPPSLCICTCSLVPTVQSLHYGLYKTSKTARRANREPGFLRTGQRLCLSLSL